MGTMGPRRRMGAMVGALAVMAAGLTACSGASSTGGGGGGGSGAPGVTATSIQVGALTAETGPLSSGFGEIVDGVRAYFDMVNAEGGVDGRKLVLADVADDTGSATVDNEMARELVSKDHVFAIVGVGTPAFSAASYLARTGTPTFGDVVSTNWADAPNLFGTYGSVLDYASDATAVAWMAKQIGARAVAVMAYAGVPASEDACRADAAGLGAAGIGVPVQDYSFSPGASPADEVFAMATQHVQLLVSCLEGPDNLAFAKEMKQYKLASADALWLDGYSRTLVAQDASAMANVYFLFQHVPFEAADDYPDDYPGMVAYIQAMEKYEPQWTYDGTAIQGWINAAQFVAGLRAVGHGTLTQRALVDAINSETAFTAGGLMPPVNWTTAHTKAVPPFCSSFSLAYQGSTVPALVRQGGQVMTCFNGKVANPVADPAGTPGANLARSAGSVKAPTKVPTKVPGKGSVKGSTKGP